MTPSLIASLALFGPIPATDHDRILAAWEPRCVAEGALLVQAETPCEDLFFIQQGVLRSLVQPLRGNEITYFFFQEAQFCTILAGFADHQPTAIRIQAACPAQVLAISRAQLDSLTQELPYMPGLINQLIQRELQTKIQTRQLYLGQDAATRYRLFLQHQPDVARRVPQHMIAAYLGITPQSLSRLRKTQS